MNLVTNLFNSAVNQYGSVPVVCCSVVAGIVLYPLIRRIAFLAFEFLTYLYLAVNDAAFFVRLRSMGCKQCAQHHRSHMSALVQH